MALHWWQRAVFYQIYPRSFADSNGDGIVMINELVAAVDGAYSQAIRGERQNDERRPGECPEWGMKSGSHHEGSVSVEGSNTAGGDAGAERRQRC